jgi:hypothetical protein
MPAELNLSCRLLTAHIDAIRAAFRSVHTQRPFRIDAIVILTQSPPLHLDVS